MTAKKSGKRTSSARKPVPSKKPAASGKASRWRRTFNWRLTAIVVAVLALVGVVAFFPIALATDQPTFCKTCHGMQPFYDAWHVGAHKNVSCIDCHVDPGYPSRFTHKFVALKEVYDQLFTRATFPNYNADVPNSRCRRCHSTLPIKVGAADQFSHQMHLSRGAQCASCHATVGHKVAFAALASAGVLNPNQVAGTTFVGEQFTGTPGRHSALPGHKPVPCANCHDQANLQCGFCHTPPANHFGADCKLCHKPGVAFRAFTHPPSGEHNYRSRPCVKCHPNSYTTVYCTCHPGGRPPKGD